MRDSDIVTPLGVAQDPLFCCSGLLAQNSLGSIRKHAKDNFVEHLLSLRHVVVRVNGIVEIFLLPTLSEQDSDIGRTSDDLVQFGIQSNLP